MPIFLIERCLHEIAKIYQNTYNIVLFGSGGATDDVKTITSVPRRADFFERCFSEIARIYKNKYKITFFTNQKLNFAQKRNFLRKIENP